jgi:hypothetical protein
VRIDREGSDMSVDEVLPVPERAIEELRARIRATRWAPDWPGLEPWEGGTDAAELRRLSAY